MSEVVILISFIVGSLTGAALTTLLSIHYTKKKITKRIKATKTFLEELDKLTSGLENKATLDSQSVNERLEKVKNIIQDQFDLQSKIEQPQRNALDGKHKNTLTGMVKKLEEDKKEILYSILRDGFDPEITAIGPNGESENMKLSEFMAEAGLRTDGVEQKRKVDRFTVHKGGKDDGDGETVH